LASGHGPDAEVRHDSDQTDVETDHGTLWR
jgi:hypothetical protein